MPHILADENIPAIAEACRSLGTVELYPGRTIPPDALERADILLCRSTVRIDQTLLGPNPRLTFVATATSGSEHVDRRFLAERNIPFANAAGSNALSVAEYLMSALFSVAAARRLSLLDRSVGVVGVGHVGTWVAHFCEALGMRTILNDPPKKERTGDPALAPLADALEADIITFHMTLTDDGLWPTRGMGNGDFFAKLRKGKIFANTSRGGVVSTKALKAAADAECFSGLILDVFEGEPIFDPDILEYCDIATPHIAGYSLDGRLLGTQMVYEALCRHLGADPAWNYRDLLPACAPFAPRIDPLWHTIEEVVNGILRQVNPVRLSDRALRKTVLLPAAERGEYFDRLRRDYPERREFAAIPIIARGVPADAAHILSRLGFPLA